MLKALHSSKLFLTLCSISDSVSGSSLSHKDRLARLSSKIGEIKVRSLELQQVLKIDSGAH